MRALVVAGDPVPRRFLRRHVRDRDQLQSRLLHVAQGAVVSERIASCVVVSESEKAGAENQG